MSLITVHRLLIKTFIAASLGFAWAALRGYSKSGQTWGLIGAMVAIGVAIAATVYLFKAPYLRRK